MCFCGIDSGMTTTPPYSTANTTTTNTNHTTNTNTNTADTNVCVVLWD